MTSAIIKLLIKGGTRVERIKIKGIIGLIGQRTARRVCRQIGVSRGGRDHGELDHHILPRPTLNLRREIHAHIVGARLKGTSCLQKFHDGLTQLQILFRCERVRPRSFNHLNFIIGRLRPRGGGRINGDTTGQKINQPQAYSDFNYREIYFHKLVN